jgi:hypothetical protein
MPEQYVAIKKKLLVEGISDKEAKSHAARIYIAQVKSKKARSERAKLLHTT